MEQTNGFRKVEGFRESIASVLRDGVAIGFRHKKLIRKAFLWTLLGGLMAVMLFGIKYESDMEVTVRPLSRTPVAITPDQSPRPQEWGDNSAVNEAQNTETELMTSADVLQSIVVSCGLQYGAKKWYTPYKLAFFRWAYPGYDSTLIPKAVSKLNDDLEVDPVKSSAAIAVSYASPDPNQSACVTKALAKFYMQKHYEVYTPPKMFDFFSEQANNYRKQVYDDEAQLLDFARTQNAVDAAVQMGLDVQQQSQFLSSYRKSLADVAQTRAQIRADESQLGSLPARIPTSIRNSDNSQLLADLKSSLANLELKRTDLVTKYDASYPLVKEVDTQIAQAQAAIAAESTAPVRENDTDNNPVYQMVQQDLAKAQSLLPSLQANADVTNQMAGAYRAESLADDVKAMRQTDLQREVSAAQGNYLLYLTKQEEARINDMLDQRQVYNVYIDEPPTEPVIPYMSPWLLVICALILAAAVAIGLAFAVDYLDPSFRTPEEVREFLDVPVFASIPENGHEVSPETQVGVVRKNGH